MWASMKFLPLYRLCMRSSPFRNPLEGGVTLKCRVALEIIALNSDKEYINEKYN